MTEIYITSEGGNLVAEVNDVKCYELYDVIHNLGFCFGDTLTVDYELDEHNDIWGLVDAIYEQCEGE